MAKKQLDIHSENILPIIKKWLYSDKDIFVRELVSNACDAISKVKILQDNGACDAADNDFSVTVSIDKANKTLTFTDNGIGMDAAEVENYIATIAFSGAEEFVSHYKSNKEGDQIIGHFGLGFYSSYMVAKSVEIDTLSYKPDAEPVLWTCDGSSDYEIGKGKRTTRGTTIVLHIDDESSEYLDESRLKSILRHYCDFLPYPVYLDKTLINTQPPLWIKPPSECTDKDYLDFYHHLYPTEEDPLFWIHMNVDYPFHLKGILYFPKIRRNMDLDKNSIRLYCNRVFVSDNCRDILPHYLLALRGAIDSPDIPLNVSRSYLQVDKTVRQLSSHISKKVADSLTSLYRSDRERFIKTWKDIATVIKIGALEDEKFYERVHDILVWKEVDGEWTTAESYLEKNRDKTDNKIYYTRDPEHLSSVIALYRAKNIDILVADNPVDTYLMQMLESKLSPAHFQRIDSEVDTALLDKDREKTIVDESGKTAAAHLANFIKSKLDDATIDVEAKSLADDSLTGLITISEQERRMRDYMMAANPDSPSLFEKKTFIVNTNNRLLTAIQSLDKTNPTLAKQLVEEVYDLARLSQREMQPDKLNAFLTRTGNLIETLILDHSTR